MAKQYISVNGGNTYLEYDSETKQSRVLVKSEIETQLNQAKERLSQIAQITDNDLLEWARQSYPSIPKVIEKAGLEQSITELETLLTSLV